MFNIRDKVRIKKIHRYKIVDEARLELERFDYTGTVAGLDSTHVIMYIKGLNWKTSIMLAGYPSGSLVYILKDWLEKMDQDIIIDGESYS